uniref:Uncharacterized protein n=1 Tax=Anguilla anguilla TaxID=7936 RepID=A0A0E9PSS2_ANGAN
MAVSWTEARKLVLTSDWQMKVLLF